MSAVARASGPRFTPTTRRTDENAMTRFRSLALLVLLSAAPLSMLGQSSSGTKLAIVGGRLIDGWGGEPVERAVILIEGDSITAVGNLQTLKVPPDYDVVDASGMTVLPGLIDLHVHVYDVGHTDLHYPASLYHRGRTPEIMALNARALLESGVTTARDVGAPLDEILALRDRLERGEIPGPRLLVSGPLLMKEVGPEEEFDHWKVTDATDARQKVRLLVSRGVDLIKVRDVEKMTAAERTAIVEEARKAGKHLATHGIYPAEIRAALDAGFDKRDTFEHTGLLGDNPLYDEDLVRQIVEREINIVPTAIVIETFSEIETYPGWMDNQEWRASLPPDIWKEVRASLDDYRKVWFFQLAKYGRSARRSKLQQLVASGARILMGSDSGARANPHTAAAFREMTIMTELGMSPMEVIMASTRLPAKFLGLSKEIGTIEKGKKADLVVVDGDPLSSMLSLRNPRCVLKGGRVYSRAGNCSTIKSVAQTEER